MHTFIKCANHTIAIEIAICHRAKMSHQHNAFSLLSIVINIVIMSFEHTSYWNFIIHETYSNSWNIFKFIEIYSNSWNILKLVETYSNSWNILKFMKYTQTHETYSDSWNIFRLMKSKCAIIVDKSMSLMLLSIHCWLYYCRSYTKSLLINQSHWCFYQVFVDYC